MFGTQIINIGDSLCISIPNYIYKLFDANIKFIDVNLLNKYLIPLRLIKVNNSSAYLVIPANIIKIMKIEEKMSIDFDYDELEKKNKYIIYIIRCLFCYLLII